MVDLLTNEPAGHSQVLVSRQPVVDGGDRVIGYRIGYALHEADGPVIPSAAQSIDLLDDVLTVIGTEEYALGSRAHLPVSREMLLHHGDAPPVAPDRVILRVRYGDMLDPAVAAIVDRASHRGYSFELDGLSSLELDSAMLRRFAAVEVDLDVFDLAAIARLMPALRLRSAAVLAAGVHTHEERDRARSLGFQWFSGPFFMTPNLVGGKPVPVGNMRTLVKLSRLQGPDVDLDELVDVVQVDLGLGVRLLRYINSAYFGLAGQVRSVRHAATMLGAAGLARWALVAASVGSNDRIPREQALLALTRARACELLAEHSGWPVDADQLFTIGLLSTVDIVFGMSVETVVEELALADATSEALVHHAGPAGEILRSVIAYEQGEFEAATLRASLSANADAYREALDWARTALTGVS